MRGVSNKHIHKQIDSFVAVLNGGAGVQKTIEVDGVPLDANRYETLGGITTYHKLDKTGFYFWANGWVLHGSGFPLGRTTPIGVVEPKRDKGRLVEKSKPIFVMEPTQMYTGSRYAGD